MEILDLVRRAASGRVAPSALRAEAARLEGDWKTAEQTLAAEIAARPAKSHAIVGAFERVAAASGDREARGRAARLRGSQLTYLKRFAESRRAYRAAIGLLSGAARDGARIGLAAAETRLGRFAAARDLCRAARRAARRRGDRVLAAGADVNEAMALHESGAPRAALALYRRGRDAFAQTGHRRHAARASMDLANALVLLDRYADAAPLFAEAADAFRDLGLAHDAALCRYNAGALCVATERLGDADLALESAEREFRALGDATNAALARLDRGEAMLRAGLAPEALRLCDSARRSLGRGAPPVERARAVVLAAKAALEAGDAAGARRLVAARATGAHAERSEIAGRAFAEGRRFAAARRRLEDAARRFGADRPASRARCLAAAAWCARESGDLAAARRLVAASARASRPLALPSLEFAASAVEFAVARSEGRRPAATAAMASAVAALERVREGLGGDAMRAALLSGREAWLAEAVRHALEEDDGGRTALALVERFKARALLDLAGDADAAAPRDETIARLRAAVASLERRAEGRPGPALLRLWSAPAGRALRTAERRLADAAAHALRPVPRDAADVASVVASLPEGTLVVALWTDEERTVRFVCSRSGVRAETSPLGASAVGRLADEFRFTVGASAFGEDYARRHAARLARDGDARLAALAAASVAPLAEEIASAARVLVVPHGPWHRVPFAALPVGGRRLVELAPVSLAPAIGALSPTVASPAGAPLVLASADEFAPRIGPEADAVAAALPGATLLAGADATFDALARSLEPRCVHIAAHGRFRPGAPGLGGVLLADGWLRALDFASLRLPGALVVLSGCETGASRVGPGDEVHGLVRGVFASGAADLVASLWRVGDEAAARLMTSFHAAGSRGLDAGRALAEAQRRAIAAATPVAHWSGFAHWTRRLGAGP